MDNIIKINTVIAQFMGYEIIKYKSNFTYNGNKFAETIGEIKELWGGLDLMFTGRFIDEVKYPFDTDFNYLIPVIRRIEEKGYVVAIKGISYQIYKTLDEKNPIVGLVCGDLSKKTSMVCDLIVEFLQQEKNI